MIKLIINTPKGGVGKTTTATNLALFLARKNFRILAVDLAGGLLMSRALSKTHEFSENNVNKIDPRETESIPKNFQGASNYDFAILDTDDAFTVSEDLLLGARTGWRVISPVNPHDPVGLDRIPKDMRAIATTAYLTPSELQISIVTNMAYGGDINDGKQKLKKALGDCGIEKLLVKTILPHSNSQTPPDLLGDLNYNKALSDFLGEINL